MYASVPDVTASIRAVISFPAFLVNVVIKMFSGRGAFVHQLLVPVAEHGCFPASRSCEHEERALYRRNCLHLVLGQVAEGT